MSEELVNYLRSSYRGVFDEASIAFHLKNHVGVGFSNSVIPWVLDYVPLDGKLLDVGSGFGAFVIAARAKGLKAFGIELEPYEVEYARRQLVTWPDFDSKEIFQLGDGERLPYAPESFDAVTLWNVLEHTPDLKRMIAGAHAVLKSGGFLFIICPNYSSFRREAHYQVPWMPWIPRVFAAAYLKLLGKNPAFFQRSIHYRTNWEVLNAVRRQGFELVLPANLSAPLSTPLQAAQKIDHPELITDSKRRNFLLWVKAFHLGKILKLGFRLFVLLQSFALPLRRMIAILDIYNPLKKSVTLCLRKPIIE
jgi:SAM-dependent methyltransferase